MTWESSNIGELGFSGTLAVKSSKRGLFGILGNER